jgi:hypothetical protein
VAATTFRTLTEHPNASVIRDVIARVPQISDRQLVALAETWRDSLEIASARAAALAADGPLVIDALAAFDAVAEVFADDLAGKPWAAPVQRSVVRIALKAVRDAIAAAYARPVLHPRQYAALMAPWERVFPQRGDGELDLGPRALDVSRVLTVLASMSQRCHEPAAALAFDEALERATCRNEEVAAAARGEAWTAALITGRRRTRVVLRRAGREALLRPCRACGTRPDPEHPSNQRVLELVLDAVGALLVADAIDVALLDVLLLPLSAHLDLDSL